MTKKKDKKPLTKKGKPLQTKGSFLDIITASTQAANNKSAKKKEE